MSEIKPVAEIGPSWDLRYVGSGPLAGLVRARGIEIGDLLYALPATHRIVSVELLEHLCAAIANNDQEQLVYLELREIIDKVQS